MNPADDSSGELLLSIVVPVYNVAPYLNEGLQSLLQADFTESYEVILIDDCDMPNGGKGKLVIERLTAKGWKVHMSEYQVVLVHGQ